ncbi:MAG TPA: hypothetical protein VGR32_12145 [Brevundimonas sp.]|jgi:hypothetical protein|uniref:hypothetical protein n=1 Tax=Brevundimonas sp. TaxID=1871086 RepID=UPI002DEFC7EF|nr:hypothetical protein [Brevundimonas sp.]
MKRLALIALAASLLAACSTYTTPGAGVPLGSIVGTDVAEAMAREPAAVFPSRMAVVRVAAPGYQSYSNSAVGAGAFSVVTTRDIETDENFERLGRMPQIAAVAPVSRLLVPATLNNVADLRASAAQLRADVILIYTIDTRFRTESAELGPLQTIALGFLPSRKAIVTATCAFMIVDVRTGFIYGTGETTAMQDQRTNVWGTENAIEAARLRAERQAFEDGLGEIEKLWASVVREHG